MDVNSKPNFMFPSRYLDFFFNWQWWAAQVVFIPLAIASMLTAFMVHNITLGAAITTFIIGVLAWTFVEYFLHRFMFHFIGEKPWLKHLHYVVHGMHHAYPTDKTRVIFPPFASIFCGVILLALLLLVMPASWAYGAMGGFTLAYSWYEFMHYASHHIKWRFSSFKKLKRQHLLHHHSEVFRDKNFGVTTSLWDHIFGTYLI